jgi:NDP-sugar pyrophosphorylase family protein
MTRAVRPTQTEGRAQTRASELSEVTALVLAGGAGTRLRSVVSDRPKPMAQAAGRPFLEHQIEWLARSGVHHVVLCVGYLHDHVQRYFGDGRDFEVALHYSVEQEFLGTGGALKLAQPFVHDTCLVLNGDSWLDVDLAALLRTHRKHQTEDVSTAGTLVLTEVPETRDFGSVRLDASGRILQFVEKSDVVGPGWVSAGIYLMEKSVLTGIPAGRSVSLEREVFPSLLREGSCLWGSRNPGFFVDIGTPDGYGRFCNHVEQYMRRQP